MTTEELNHTSESKWILFTYDKIYQRVKKTPSFTYEDFNKQEKYISNCFEYHSRILNTCTQLEQVIIFMRRFDKNYFKSNGIGQSDFIQYHLEVYVGKLFTLMELLFQYTNIIYQLELKPKQCSLKNIKKKIKKENLTIKVLSTFYDNLAYWRLIRNRTVHQNKFSKDEEFERLSAEEFLWLQYESLNHEPEIDWIVVKPRHFVDWFLKQERRKKIKFIKNNNYGTNDYIASFDKYTVPEIKQKMAMQNSKS